MRKIHLTFPKRATICPASRRLGSVNGDANRPGRTSVFFKSFPFHAGRSDTRVVARLWAAR